TPADAIERLGIGLARREREGADLVLLVLDRSEPLRAVDRALLDTCASTLVVANKCDLPPAWEPETLTRQGSMVCAVSAEKVEGLDALVGAVASRLVSEHPVAGMAVPFRPEHLLGLEEARACLSRGDVVGFVRALQGIAWES